MNSRLYRVIFNKHLGRLVVVSEKTMAQGKAGSQGGSDTTASLADSQQATSTAGVVHYRYGKWVSLTAAVLVGMGGANVAYADVQTQIIADKGAPKNEQATVLNTANGLAQVNIQTPNSQGVSKNTFSQFDVGSTGAILNNSRTNTQTQTAGWVEGNPWLAKGEAKIILNQVNSSNPSQLAGYTEIAGGKAELIIANPAGITCSGCGFINASRTTLTTGKPTFNNDTLTGFQVNSGKISVDGKGLDDSQSDYTQLISQTNAINAKIYSKQLDVITGNNTVSYEDDPNNTKVTNNGGNHSSNQSTGVALDISNLGGMYAGKIRLIGTDKGMGVTNAGDISSSSTLTLDNQGNLINTGSMSAKQGVNLKHSGDIDNQGTISSSTDGVKLDSQTLTNSGVISSHGQTDATNQRQISNTGLISAGQVSLKTPSLTNQGRIEQTGSGKLDLTSQTLTNKDNAVIGQSLYDNHPATTTPTLANAPSTAQTGSTQQVATPTTTATTSSNETTLTPITADGSIQADNLVNQGNNAMITGNGVMTVTSPTLSNQNQGSIAVNALNTKDVNNNNSRIQLDKLDWQLTSFNNRQGQIVAKQGITLQAPQINNQQGVLATPGDIKLTSGSLNNQQGLIQGNQATINATNVDNSQGTIQANANLNLDAQGNLTNQSGHINAQGDATIGTTNINNNKGSVVAGGKLTTTSQTLTNSGQLYGSEGNTLTTGSLTNTDTGLIAAQGNTDIHAQTISNQGTFAAGIDSQGNLSTTPANLTVNATGALTSSGTHIATGKATLQGNPTDLTGSKTQAADIEMASQGDLSTQGASITATHQLTLAAKGTLNNQDGHLSGQTLKLTGNQLDNQRGSISQSGNAELNFNFAGGINNQQGQIATNSQNFTINTSTLNNQAGHIEHAGSGQLNLTANNVNNSDKGNVLSLGEQTWQIAGDINNQTGVIQGNNFAINAHQLDNTQGSVVATADKPTGKTSRVTLSGDLINQAGTIGNNAGALSLTAATVNNTTGKVLSLGDQTWQLAGDINNTQGQIQGDGITLAAHTLTNTDGQVVGSNTSGTAKANQLNLTGDLNNTGNGVIYSDNGSLALTAQTVTNPGQITSRGDLQVNTQSLDNSGSISSLANVQLNNQANLTNTATIAAQGHLAIQTGELNQAQTGQLVAGLNPDNTLSATPQHLTITSTGAQHNQGSNVASGNMAVAGSALDYHGSRNQAVNLSMSTPGDIDVSQSQNKVSQQASFTANALNHNDAVTQADGYQFKVQSLSNLRGTLEQTGTQDFVLTTGSIDNQQGHLGGNATNLSLTATGDIHNQGGEIIHAGTGSANLTAQNIDNSQAGKLLSNGNLTTTVAGNLLNDTGDIEAKNVDITAGSLSNTNGQVIASEGDLTVKSGNLTNSGEKAVLQSAQALHVNAGTLNNHAKAQLLANTTADIQAGTLNNDSDGLIYSNQALHLNGGTLNNNAVISSLDTLTANSQTLNNQASGNIQAGKDINLTQQTLTNQGVITTQANINSTTQGVMDNHAGQVIGNNVTLAAQSLNNQGGSIQQADKNGQLTLTTTGLLDNQNTQGEAQGILANGKAVLNTGDIANQSGVINAAGDLAVISTGNMVNNSQGVIGSNHTLNLTGTNATINNQGGKLWGDNTTISANGLANTGAGSLISATKDVTLHVNTIDNQNTKQDLTQVDPTQGVIAGNNLAIQAQTLNNTQGQLLANQGISAAIGQSLTNTNGLIEAKTISTQGSTGHISNAGGVIRANDTTLSAGAISNGGEISGDTLTLNQVGDYTNAKGDKLQANNLTITTQGNVNNEGMLSADKQLTVNAKDINNAQTGELSSNEKTLLNATGDINNHGLINGDDTFITAGHAVNNLSEGRIYGTHLAIKADTLNNTPGNTLDSAPVIAARERLDIGVKTLNNNPNAARSGKFNSDFNGQAQILSNGELHIGGDLDGENHATGKATTVTNRGATIESLGDMQIAAETLNNVNADYSKITYIDDALTKHVTEYFPNNSDNKTPIAYDIDSDLKHYDSSEANIHLHGWNGNWLKTLETPDGDYNQYDRFIYDSKTYKDRTNTSDPALIRAGGNLTIDAQQALNDKSMVIDGSTLALKEDPANPKRFGFMNVGETGVTTLEHSDIKHKFYETHDRTRPDNPLSDRPYTKPHTMPDVPTQTKQLASYELPVLNVDISSVPVTYANTSPANVAKVNQAINDLKTLLQTAKAANNGTQVDSTNLTGVQDAIKVLQDFNQTNPGNLTAEQQKQLADLLAAQQAGQKVDVATLSGLINQLSQSINDQKAKEVRTQGAALGLPNSALYKVDPNNPNGYLVATDPAFAGYKNWLSSDYMMKRLGLNQDNMHKRLGDGYYEQRMLRDQVMALTGKRFLGDYRSDDAMYQALMDNGVASANALNLRPGIALTASQMAQLTTDIVWLVEQNITLPNGQTQKVLVPKVYVRSNVGDIKGDGSLIAGYNTDVQLTGDLNNSGNIVGHHALRVSANNVNNNAGGVIQGNFVQINSKKDTNNIGGTIKADSAMSMTVGGNLNNTSTTYHTESSKGKSNAWRTGLDQIASIYVGDGLKGQVDDEGNPLTTLAIDVAGNTTFNASQLINHGGSTQLISGGNIAFNAVNTGYQTNAIHDNNNYIKSGHTEDVGSVVASQGDTIIRSKNGNITGTAATIHSEDGITYLKADNGDISFKEGRETNNLETAYRSTEKTWLSKKTTQNNSSYNNDLAIKGSIDGDRVIIDAKNNVHLTATDAISQQGTYIKGGKNVTIDAAANTEHQSSSHSEKKSGLFGTDGGIGFTIGTQRTQNQNSMDSVSHTGSIVGTENGNTIITAGEHYQQTGSKVYAKNQTTDDVHDLNYGTVVINAKSANVDNTVASSESHSRQSQKTSGLTVKVSNSLVDQAQGIQDLAKAGETTSSDQMKVMAGVAGFSKLRTLGKGVQGAVDSLEKNGLSEKGLKGVGNSRIQATLGSQSSSSSHDSLSGNNEASSIDTNNLVLNIQGKGKDSDFTVTGSDINLAGDLYNNVEGDVIYRAASGTGYDRTSNKSSGFGVGVYASTQSGMGLTANANMAKGYGNGETTTNANSHINVGGTTYQNIGGNLVLDGAVVKGDYATGHIGGGIIATSRQDTAKYDGKNTNAGFSADLDLKGAGSNVSVNGGRTRANADYAAVTEQTGLQYRKSDMVVDGKSTFKGAYFTTATPEDNQTQFKGGLEVSDIQNHSKYKADGINVGLSAGLTAEGAYKSGGISGIGYGRDSDSQTNTTYGAVTGRAGKADVTTGTVDSLNTPLANTFDKDRVNAQINAQVSVTQAFDTERRSYRMEMATKEQELRDKAKEAEKRGDMATHDALIDKADKQQHDMVLFDSITGAIYGPNTNGATGYVARAVAPQVSYQIGQYFKGNDFLNGLDGGNRSGEGSAPHILAHGILAAAVSAATGNNVTTGALSAMGAEAAAPMVSKFLFKTDDPSQLTAEQKATVSSITSLAGLGMGATTGDVGSAVNAQQIGQVAVDDNLLSNKDLNTLQSLYEKAEKNQGYVFGLYDKYKLSLDDSINLTNLAILDQVGNGLISKYKTNPKSLTADELTVLNKILNYYYSSGGKLEDIANLFTPGAIASNDYLLQKGINGIQEEIFMQAANTRRIQSAVEENARMGGDAVWAAPGGFMNIVRRVVGSATVASGIKDVQNGKKGEGVFKIVGGALMFVPINSSTPVPISKIGSLSTDRIAIPEYSTSSIIGNLSMRRFIPADSVYNTGVTGYKIGSAESVNNAAIQETNKILSSGLSKNKLKSQSAVAVAGDPTLGIQTKAYINTDISLPTVAQLEASGTLKVTQIKGESYFVILNKDRYMDTLRKGYMQSQNPLTPIMENNIYKYINSKTYFASAAYLPGAHAEVQAQNALYRMSSRVNPNNVQVATYKLGTSSKSGVQGGKFTACSHCSGITPPGTNITTGRK